MMGGSYDSVKVSSHLEWDEPLRLFSLLVVPKQMSCFADGMENLTQNVLLILSIGHLHALPQEARLVSRDWVWFAPDVISRTSPSCPLGF